MSSSFFQTTREIFVNPIWKNIIEFRLFFYLYGNAVFKKEGVKYGDVHIKRGQCLRSYRNLQTDLEYIENGTVKRYSLNTLKSTINKLVNDGRITIEKTKLGTLFTIVNYDKYQNLGVYGEHIDLTKKSGTQGDKNHQTEHKQNTNRTPAEHQQNNKNNVNNDKKEKIYKEIFEFWIQQEGLIKHQKLTASMKKAIDKGMKHKTVEEAKKAIARVNAAITDKDYFYNNKWALANFFKQKNGITEWLNEGQNWNNYKAFLKQKKSFN